MRYVIAGFLLLAAAVVPAVVFSSTPAADLSGLEANGPLVVCDGQEDALRFVLKPGGKLERDIWIENRSAETTTISKIETTCDCVTVQSPFRDLTLAVGERKPVKINLDLSTDPSAMKDFGPDVRLFDARGSPIGVVRLDVSFRE